MNLEQFLEEEYKNIPKQLLPHVIGHDKKLINLVLDKVKEDVEKKITNCDNNSSIFDHENYINQKDILTITDNLRIK